MAQLDPAKREALVAAVQSLTSFRDLATLLDVNSKQLGFYLNAGRIYRTFPLKKKSGGERLISCPRTGLFHIQQKLVPFFNAFYKGRSPVHGFVPGRSIRSNAHKHLNSAVLMNMDLLDFFPSITFPRIFGLLRSKPYSLPSNIAAMVARLCTTREGKLPVGSPTSPILSNMICGHLDKDLKNLARAGELRLHKIC